MLLSILDSQVHDHAVPRYLDSIIALRYDSLVSKIITYISIDGREKLVCILVIVLTGVGHDSVEDGLLLGHSTPE